MSEHKDFRTGRTPEAGEEFAGPFTVPDKPYDPLAILKGVENRGQTGPDTSPLFDGLQDTYSPIAFDAILSRAGECLAEPASLITIGGVAKSGKSAFVRGIISPAIAEPGADVLGIGIDVKANPEKRAVLMIDTEQSRHRQFPRSIYRILKRIHPQEMAPARPKHFYPLSWRGYSPGEKLSRLGQCFEDAANLHGGVFLCVLDGVADFLTDTNSLEEAGQVVGQLMEWADTYQCVILQVMHQNQKAKNQDGLRGAAGSELERKGDGSIMLTKDRDTGLTRVSFEYLRSAGPVPDYAIEYDDELKDWRESDRAVSAKAENDTHQKKALTLPRGEILAIANQVFSGELKGLSKEVAGQRMAAAGICGITYARHYLTRMESEKIIHKPKGKGWVLA